LNDKEQFDPMKRPFLLAVSAAVLIGLCGCSNPAAELAALGDTPQQQTVEAPLDDAAYEITLPAEAAALPGGAKIAFACDAAGEQTGPNAMVWQGVQSFSQRFGYEAASYVAADGSTEAAVEAVRQAAESGAAIVVCQGDAMACAVYSLQSTYPTVSYLLLDDEPHNPDYSLYSTSNNVHCVLFREEQAGFLAGYAAVTDGYTDLGFLGGPQNPGTVRYCTGFLQGANAAAAEEGVQVQLRSWFCGVSNGSSEITGRMSGWYSDGMQLIMVSGGTLAQSCIDAAGQLDGNAKVITTDSAPEDWNDTILASAIKCYNAATQQYLYRFFAAGGDWEAEWAGQSSVMDVMTGGVGFVSEGWRLDSFSQSDYAQIYEQLRVSELTAERYSDLDTLPLTDNVDFSSQH